MDLKKDEVTILLAEDDDGHAELITDNLHEAGITNNILRFKDGQEIWEFLSGEGGIEHREHNKSYLLLLDINMPKMNGVEVLKKIKNDHELKKIPVIMLTTTDDPREIEQCYLLGCNSYVTKPVNFADFADTLKKLGAFLLVVKVAHVNGD